MPGDVGKLAAGRLVDTRIDLLAEIVNVIGVGPASPQISDQGGLVDEDVLDKPFVDGAGHSARLAQTAALGSTVRAPMEGRKWRARSTLVARALCCGRGSSRIFGTDCQGILPLRNGDAFQRYCIGGSGWNAAGWAHRPQHAVGSRLFIRLDTGRAAECMARPLEFELACAACLSESAHVFPDPSHQGRDR